ncbi:MAG: helix-turn-helix transcriptional regulator [Chitinophagaceae bacterium]
MKPPLKIYFPPGVCENVQISNELLGEFAYKIPFADVCSFTCSMGSFLTQAVCRDDYWIELWCFSIKVHSSIEIKTLQSCAALILFLKGYVEQVFSDETTVVSRPKSFNFFYFPIGSHQINFVEGEFVILIIIPPHYYLSGMAVEHDGMREVLNRLSTKSEESLLLKSFPLPHSAFRMISQMKRTRNAGASLDFELRRYILEILSLYFDQLKNNSTEIVFLETAVERTIACKKYIEENVGSAKLGGLNELARIFLISTKSLTKEFKILTGKTVPQFINDERIRRSIKLLQIGNLKIFEIAILAGFSDTANFIRIFKKNTGYPPAKYKKLNL